MSRPRIYLDNAATSWPKPESVYRAVDDYQRRLGAPAGRSSYAEAAETERLVVSCRKKIAALLGASDPARIVFTQNGTDSLNLALHGLLRSGDHVVTTVCEHNSVLRPLRFLQERGISTSYVPCDGEGWVDPDAVRRAITPQTRLIALVQASNVTGAVQPAQAVGRIAAEYGVYFLVDAAQSLGHIPVKVADLGCQLLAAPGHKGLLGPLGTGLLYIAPDVEQHLQPVRQGGTGTRSDEDRQPDALPDRYESGNLNVPGIVGLEAGISFLEQKSLARVHEEGRALIERLMVGIRDLPGLQLYGPRSSDRRVGVVSLNLRGYEPQELAGLLDAQWSIQCRAGLHCAPRMHQAIGTLPRGTLRLSIGPFTAPAEIDSVVQSLAEIASG